MTKLDFINELGQRLASLPRDEVQELLTYYIESIDDRMEDGMTEAEAIDSLGSLDELAEKAMAEHGGQESDAVPAPDSIPAPEKAAGKKRIPLWAFILLVLGSPIWLGLGISVLAVVFSLWISVWCVLISFAAAGLGMLLGGLVGAVLIFVIGMPPGTLPAKILIAGAALIVAALGCLLLLGSIWLMVLYARLHRAVFRKHAKKEVA